MKVKSIISVLALSLLPVLLSATTAATTGAPGLGDVANTMAASLGGIKTLIITIATIAGLGFGVAAVFKFKQHRDNPQQVPLGQPLSLLAIAVMLLWLPFLLQSSGQTLTGGKSKDEVGKVPTWLN